MPVAPSSIKNAYKRSDVYRKQKRDKGQEKLRRRLETKKDEASADGGEERKQVCQLLVFSQTHLAEHSVNNLPLYGCVETSVDQHPSNDRQHPSLWTILLDLRPNCQYLHFRS